MSGFPDYFLAAGLATGLAAGFAPALAATTVAAITGSARCPLMAERTTTSSPLAPGIAPLTRMRFLSAMILTTRRF